MFRVDWLEEAIDELATIWMRADSDKRGAVTEASSAIDRELQSDPFRQSESRDDGRRVLFVPPLGAFFRVDMQHRIVWVGHVWHFRPGPK